MNIIKTKKLNHDTHNKIITSSQKLVKPIKTSETVKLVSNINILITNKILINLNGSLIILASRIEQLSKDTYKKWRVSQSST